MSYLKGRGAQINTANKFNEVQAESEQPNYLEEYIAEKWAKTEFIPVFPKTVINKVTSPDVGMDYSINPYQGCEHGCIYCYARNTHNYWGYSAGVEFEQKIMVKQNTIPLLTQKLRSKHWKAKTIVLSGNTDCYQPIERKEKITRKILETMWRFRHPVGIITKNSLVLRDMDILKKLNSKNLVHVIISITTLNEDLRRKMEPRTSTATARLKTIRKLTDQGIPVRVMMAPIIPGLTDHEIFLMAEKTAAHGALTMNHTIVRLNGDVGPIFKDWLKKNYPDRYDKVINRVKEAHGGKVNDSRIEKRMRGEGKFAESISLQMKLAKEKYFEKNAEFTLNTELHQRFKSNQLTLF